MKGIFFFIWIWLLFLDWLVSAIPLGRVGPQAIVMTKLRGRKLQCVVGEARGEEGPGDNMLKGLFTEEKLYLHLWFGLKFAKSLSLLKYGKHVPFSTKKHPNILKALVQLSVLLTLCKKVTFNQAVRNTHNFYSWNHHSQHSQFAKEPIYNSGSAARQECVLAPALPGGGNDWTQLERNTCLAIASTLHSAPAVVVPACYRGHILFAPCCEAMLHVRTNHHLFIWWTVSCGWLTKTSETRCPLVF